MRVDYTAAGIHLPEIGVWLDPREARPAAWLSHGHSDHATGLHGMVYGTPDTLRFYRKRWPEDPAVSQQLQPLPFHQTLEHGGARLTAYPAGHILGAAQLLVEFGGERLVYTGDIKLRPPLCGDATETVACDRLIIESTFGLPIYHFISKEDARQRILDFARECLADSTAPVFLGYPLGRGQEIAHVLTRGGIPAAIHGAIARYIPEYEAAGYDFPGWQPYDSRDASPRALVVVPGMRNYLEASGRAVRVAYVSGWAALDNARTRAGAEELIPYSDHASFQELLEMIEATGAKDIDIVHGYTEPFARYLVTAKGLRASAPQYAAQREEPES
ncbi:MAG: hypothetical protein SFV54_17470 [Bryobacteraceae bacterium]|nr:hypothetical protein [Bryobacteraceae bacterium]